MMSSFVATYLKLWYARKPTLAAVQGWCIGGGTDMVLCADLIVAGESASFGYPPARVWGTPTTAMWVYRMGLERAKRYLLTGDEIPARTAAEIGLILEAVPDAELEAHAFALAARMARLPLNQLVMLKLLCNQTAEQMGFASSRLLGTLFDGIARHTQEGLDFVARAQQARLPPGGARARRPVRRLREPAAVGAAQGPPFQEQEGEEMKRIWIVSLASLPVLAMASAVSAGTLATGLMYWDDGTPGTSCFATNIGTKPVTVLSVTLQDAESTDLAPVSDSCTTVPLAPGHSCFWEGAPPGYGGGRIEVKGSAKLLRGRCVLRDAVNGDVLGAPAELR